MFSSRQGDALGVGGRDSGRQGKDQCGASYGAARATWGLAIPDTARRVPGPFLWHSTPWVFLPGTHWTVCECFLYFEGGSTLIARRRAREAPWQTCP